MGKSSFVFSFSGWIKKLVGLVFMAPLFVFFLYLTVKFLSIGIGINPSLPDAAIDNVANLFMSVLFPLALVIAILDQGRKTTKEMSGEFGDMAGKFLGGLAGFAVGGVLGGTARRLVGGTAGAFKRSDIGKRAGAGEFGRLGRGLYSGARNLEGVSFDFRSREGLIGKAGGAMGFGMKDFGSAQGRGGAASARKKYIARKQATALDLKKTEDTDSATQKAQRSKVTAEGKLTKARNKRDQNPIIRAARLLENAAKSLKEVAQEEKKAQQLLTQFEAGMDPEVLRAKKDLESDNPKKVKSAKRFLKDYRKEAAPEKVQELDEHDRLTEARDKAEASRRTEDARYKSAKRQADELYTTEVVEVPEYDKTGNIKVYANEVKNKETGEITHRKGDLVYKKELRYRANDPKADKGLMQIYQDIDKGERDVAITAGVLEMAKKELNQFNDRVLSRYAQTIEGDLLASGNQEAASKIRRGQLTMVTRRDKDGNEVFTPAGYKAMVEEVVKKQMGTGAKDREEETPTSEDATEATATTSRTGGTQKGDSTVNTPNPDSDKTGGGEQQVDSESNRNRYAISNRPEAQPGEKVTPSGIILPKESGGKGPSQRIALQPTEERVREINTFDQGATATASAPQNVSNVKQEVAETTQDVSQSDKLSADWENLLEGKLQGLESKMKTMQQEGNKEQALVFRNSIQSAINRSIQTTKTELGTIEKNLKSIPQRIRIFSERLKNDQAAGKSLEVQRLQSEIASMNQEVERFKKLKTLRLQLLEEQKEKLDEFENNT